MMAKKNKIKKRIAPNLNSGKTGDLSIVLLVLGLCIFGTIMIFSASYYYALATEGNAYEYLKKQVVWLLIGIVVMWIASKIDYHIYDKFYLWIYGAGLLLLVAVITPGVGSEVGGATRWILVGPITIMPGEISKICIIFAIAGFYRRYPNAIKRLGGVVIPVTMTVVYAGLILIQPNMSTASTVILICAGMMLVAGVKVLHLLGLGALASAAIAFLIYSAPYRRERYLSFLDPFKYSLDIGYQVVQSLLALGTGGVKGLGLGNSVQKTLYLSQPHNDFILAIIGEELGLAGIYALIIAYVLLLWRISSATVNAKDYYGMMLAAGITTMIGVQVIINIAVVTSSMPPTGLILPFVSYGGNALVLLLGLIGVLINITKQSAE